MRSQEAEKPRGNEYEPVIGLEVHAQLATNTKLFCACPTRFGDAPNTNICPVCTGQPGTLPVLNKMAVEMAIKAALALRGKIQEKSSFARKNYFYPDLPKGYQISQYEFPLSMGGFLDIEAEDKTKRISIQRIHLEEDAGKLLHDRGGIEVSHIDFNRCGVPLIEIVSGPDFSSAKEAVAYFKKLRSTLVYTDVCEGNMQEGKLRCDANISLKIPGSKKLGTRTEIKNLNSFKFLEQALIYEIQRQAKVLDNGGTVLQETLLWNELQGITFSMRSKEEAHDYRYFPDPDLLPLVVESGWVGEIEKTIPELPDAKASRFMNQHGLPSYDAKVLTAERGLADYYEECVSHHANPKKIANWILTELLCELKERGIAVSQISMPPRHLATLVASIDEGVISGTMAKSIFLEMLDTGKDPEALISEKGLTQIGDEAEIEKIVAKIIANQPENVKRYKSGKTNVLGHFVGEVMKATGGKANPKLANEILRKKLQ